MENQNVRLLQEIIDALNKLLGPDQFRFIINMLLIIIGLTFLKAIDIIISATKEVTKIVVDGVRTIADGACCFKKLIPCL